MSTIIPESLKKVMYPTTAIIPLQSYLQAASVLAACANRPMHMSALQASAGSATPPANGGFNDSPFDEADFSEPAGANGVSGDGYAPPPNASGVGPPCYLAQDLQYAELLSVVASACWPCRRLRHRRRCPMP